MQVLDSIYNQLFQLPKELQIALQNIVDHLEIKSFYSIKHPDYKLLELPESVIARFKNLSLDIQEKHLRIHLRNFSIVLITMVLGMILLVMTIK